jgi:hypothetical protein
LPKTVTLGTNGNATDELLEIPAVGSDGVATTISSANFEVKLNPELLVACPPRP